jgi:hypothetical protein
VAVAAFALAVWPVLATGASHTGGGGGASHGGGGGAHASGGGGHYGGHSGGGWHSSGGGHVSSGGHAVPRGSYGQGYTSRGYGYGRGYGGYSYHGRGYGYGGRGYGYGRGYRYGYGGGPVLGLGFDFGWPYYGAGYYDVAPYNYYGYPNPDGGYIADGDAHSGDARRYSGGDDPYDRNPGDYSQRGGPNNQPQSGGGVLRIAVRPLDASIYVDGRFWGSGRSVSSLPLTEGRHRVEVARPGFRTYTQDFDVNADRPVQLSITLERP